MAPCRGLMGRRSSIAGRPCPSRTKHASGLCALHRASAAAKTQRAEIVELRAELASAMGALKLYRLKFATSDMGGWDAKGHLLAMTALQRLGEPGITFEEGCKLAREIPS